MNKVLLTLCLLLFVSMVSLCQTAPVIKDTTDKKPPLPPLNRNMFGQGVPRGLRLNTDGLADGYILFAVPNSASVYLMNRKGEVVHEWKGNYNGFGRSAYLGDDGSLYLNADDPDFPVFAGGGESGRIQRIGWNNKMLWDFEYATEEYLSHHDFALRQSWICRRS